MTPDFVEMLCALSDAGVEYLLVGAHARAVHGTPRATGDLDLWVRRTPENARRMMRALAAFGAPLHELSEADLLEPELVFQIGVAPNRIDLLTDVSGVTFDDAWPRKTWLRLQGIEVPVIGRDDYLANKRATGRMRDLADVEDVEANG
ncbi:MAG: hypothetical protein VKS61_10760 [Candidatus Sericytochromatia bacterium]|nr:hypothetical protein [Candidatus Sericytochromatia bacterium]